MTSNTEVFDANGVIRFNSVTGPEQGSYVCSATNEVGTVTATAMLTIKGLFVRLSTCENQCYMVFHLSSSLPRPLTTYNVPTRCQELKSVKTQKCQKPLFF